MRITPVAPVYSVSTFNGHREQSVYIPKRKEKIVQYITHNQDDLINSNMTSLRGCITASYTQLVATFGMPLKDGFDDYKSDAEWLVKFDDGTVATIYNWKDGINYCGSEHGIPTESITDWHIGGHTSLAVDYVKQALREGV